MPYRAGQQPGAVKQFWGSGTDWKGRNISHGVGSSAQSGKVLGAVVCLFLQTAGAGMGKRRCSRIWAGILEWIWLL